VESTLSNHWIILLNNYIHFKIIQQIGIASGIRRIEALTGDCALKWLTKREKNYQQTISNYQEKLKQQQKLFTNLQQKYYQQISDHLLSEIKTINQVNLLTATFKQFDIQALRFMTDCLSSRLDRSVIVLSSINDQKIILIAVISQSLTMRLHAGKLINYVAKQIGGKGGGRANRAQGGGNQVRFLKQALASVESWIAKHCSS